MTRFDVARTRWPKSTVAYGSLRIGPPRNQLKRTIGMLPTPDNSECSRQTSSAARTGSRWSDRSRCAPAPSGSRPARLRQSSRARAGLPPRRQISQISGTGQAAGGRSHYRPPAPIPSAPATRWAGSRRAARDRPRQSRARSQAPAHRGPHPIALWGRGRAGGISGTGEVQHNTRQQARCAAQRHRVPGRPFWHQSARALYSPGTD